MKFDPDILLIPLFIAALLSIHAAAARPDDPAPSEETAVRQAALDYIEGWYEADTERMSRALHPDLVKRKLQCMPDGSCFLRTVSKEAMVAFTRNGGGADVPVDQRQIEVIVLDISPTTASVKTTCKEYIDHLHLSKVDGHWLITNVLWETREVSKE